MVKYWNQGSHRKVYIGKFLLRSVAAEEYSMTIFCYLENDTRQYNCSFTSARGNTKAMINSSSHFIAYAT